MSEYGETRERARVCVYMCVCSDEKLGIVIISSARDSESDDRRKHNRGSRRILLSWPCFLGHVSSALGGGQGIQYKAGGTGRSISRFIVRVGIIRD